MHLRSRHREFDAGKLAAKRLWCEALEIAVEDEPGTGLRIEYLADELVGVNFVGSWSCQNPIFVSIIYDCVFKTGGNYHVVFSSSPPDVP
jgi:hypothetical protein